MTEQQTIDRITRLLRLARDQEGTPEGRTAGNIAQVLMKRAGIVVELEEREEATTAMLAVEPLPVPWKEFLACSIAAAYRCQFFPRWNGMCWQIWIASEPERVASCQDHYNFLSRQVVNRITMIEASLGYLRRSHPIRYETLVKSYSEGLVYECAKQLLALLGWAGPLPFEQFDQDKFEEDAQDPLSHDSDEDQDHTEPGLMIYRYRAPADAFPDEELVEAPSSGLGYDSATFARGRSEQRHLTLVPARLSDAWR